MTSEQLINWNTNSVRDDIEKKFHRNNYFNRNFSSHFYEEVVELQAKSKFKAYLDIHDKTFYANNLKFVKPLIYISIFWLFLTIKDCKKITQAKTNPLEFWLFIILSALVLYMIYYTVIKKKKKFLEITEEYLIINTKMKIKWNDILVTGILTVNYRYGQERRVVIGTINKIITLNRENSNLLPEDIIQIIFLHKSKNALPSTI